MTGLVRIPGYFSLAVGPSLSPQNGVGGGLTPPPRTAARPLTSDEGGLLPGLLQQ